MKESISGYSGGVMRKLSATRKITYTAMSVALLALGALIHIPATPPITLQLFVLYLVLFLFGGMIGSISTSLYVIMGIIGLPVFSGFSGGFGRLFEVSGGYIVAFIPCTIVYLIISGGDNKRRILAAAVSVFALYLTAFIWYVTVYLDVDSAVYVTVTFIAPYVIPDLIKIALAYIVSKRLEKYVSMKVR